MDEHREDRSTVEQLYDAFWRRDGAGLAALLHRDFTGYVSEGMPLGVGGTIPSRASMLNLWSTIAARFRVAPVPEEIVSARDGRFFVLGRYRGTGAAGAPLDAAFVHVIEVRDGAIVSLKQVTDTARWTAN
ncbi:nuclear transport factor 2 family protein [Pendulispora albinea]|uniref:Nuclear transport factor 2 family protein n=1 Tax=Pendulispora albinea TaxID=2741071 RepID=A0ABZ2LQW0_9BACT